MNGVLLVAKQQHTHRQTPYKLDGMWVTGWLKCTNEKRIVAYHAVAERTVILSKDVSCSSCSDIGRNHEINYTYLYIVVGCCITFAAPPATSAAATVNPSSSSCEEIDSQGNGGKKQ